MRIVWSLLAQADIIDIAERYDLIDPELANEIVRRLEVAVEPLTSFAHLGSLVDGLSPLRKWSVASTPYIILYMARHEVVEVQRVVHASSDWRP